MCTRRRKWSQYCTFYLPTLHVVCFFICQNLCWVSLLYLNKEITSPLCELSPQNEYPKGKQKINSTRFTGQMVRQSQDLPIMSIIILTLLFHVIAIVCCPPESSMSSQQGGASRGRADHLRDPRSGYSISSRLWCSLSSLTGPRHLWWWPCPLASEFCPFRAECSPPHILQCRGWIVKSLTEVKRYLEKLIATMTIDRS